MMRQFQTLLTLYGAHTVGNAKTADSPIVCVYEMENVGMREERRWARGHTKMMGLSGHKVVATIHIVGKHKAADSTIMRVNIERLEGESRWAGGIGRRTLRHGVAQRQIVHGRGDGAQVRECALDVLRRAREPATPTAASGRTAPAAAKVAASASTPAASTLVSNVPWPTHTHTVVSRRL